MKKVISLLLVLVVVFGVSATAFAADDTTGLLTGDDTESLFSTSVVSVASFPDTSEDGETLDAAIDDLVLVNTEDSADTIVYPDTVLTPGEDYTFEIHRVTAIANNLITTQPLTTADLASGNRLRISSKKGSSVISSSEIDTKSKTYILELTTKTNYGTKMTDVEYTFSSNKQSQIGVSGIEGRYTGTPAFKVGYRTVLDETIDDYTEGDIVVIEEEYPVYTKKQLERIAKENNYAAVVIEGEDSDWRFEGRISGMSDTNFIYTYDVIPAIITKFEDQDFKFLLFNGGVTFPSNGTMTIDVSDVSDDFERIYCYLYRNGVLEELTPAYDSSNDEISFRTNYLGGFVITDTRITDTTIIGNDDDDDDVIDDDDDDTGTGTNPGTGGVNTGIAIALALTSVTSAAVLGRKKK